MLSVSSNVRSVCFSLILLAVLSLSLPGAVVLSHPGLLGADLNYLHFPHQAFLHEHYKQGVIPFWNPYSYGGCPEFGNPEKAPMYPLHFVGLMLFGPEGMLKLKYLFHLALGSFGAYALLRALWVRRALALPAALTVGTSGFAITKFALPTVGDSVAWIGAIAWLHLRFSRRPTLGRGLQYGAALGVMLMMFFPQINLTLLLGLGLAACLGLFRLRHGILPLEQSRGKSIAASRSTQTRLVLHRWVLPVAECLFVISLLRYPPTPVHFPEPGWRCAFSGMGWLGVFSLSVAVAGWMLLFVLLTPITRLNRRSVIRNLLPLGVIWIWGALLAAPQLAITGELIASSNQKTLDYSCDEDFFTGAQAYGSVRAFLQSSILAHPKEAVNNMALGPVVWFFALLGLLFGFHRTHRAVGFMTVAVAFLVAVYMAAPGLFDVFRRLPFFKGFSGLSRYLGFISFMLVIMAALNATLALRRLPAGKWRARAFRLVVILFWTNLGLLYHHQMQVWTRVEASTPYAIPEEVAHMVRRHLGVGERVIVDAREQPHAYALLMFPFANRLLSLPEYAPMRTARYDVWQDHHNSWLGTDHSDYRAGFLEPYPSPWSRASRIGLFLFAPGAVPPKVTAMDETRVPTLTLCDTWQGWTLMRDVAIPQIAWPESDLDRQPPQCQSPEGWSAVAADRGSGFAGGIHKVSLQVTNPHEDTWMVIPQAWYPGWRGWVNGQRADVRMAYGFLTALRVPSGESNVRLEYWPFSFSAGWVAFLWALWTLCVLLTAGRRSVHIFRSQSIAGFVFHALLGFLAIGFIGCRVFLMRPDALWQRLQETAVVVVLAAFVGWWVRRRRHCNDPGRMDSPRSHAAS